MPGVQCVICLSSDTSTDEWCALRECGHVFHTHCLEQSLEHNRRCPQCRTDYSGRKYGGGKLPYQRVFFEFSDEPLSQPLPAGGGGAGGGGGGGADLAQVAFLQGQLRDKDRRLQTMATQLVESEDKATQLQADLSLARSGLRDTEARLQAKIGELSREHKQVKSLANQVANLTAQLKTESGRTALLNLAADHTLVGSALGTEVRKLVQLGMKAPNDFWEKLMSERNSIIAANNNRHARERSALERQQEKLQAEVARLQGEMAVLRRSLTAAWQGQPGGTAMLADTLLDAPQQRAPAGPRHALRRFGGGSTAGGAGGGASSSAAAAAADDEDPLLQSYDLLDSMRVADLPAARQRQPSDHQTQQAQQQQAQQQQQQQQQQACQITAGASVDEDEIVLLDGSEEQWQDEAEGQQWEDEEEVCLSEEELDLQPQLQQSQQTAAPPPPAQQQQQQAAAASQQQRQQQAGGSSLLGKRQVAAAAAAAADENCLGGNGAGAALLPLAAGPGRAALHRGPGKTFIRNTSAASLGIDRGRYISSGPDGKGGVATAYQSGKSGGGAVRMAQRQLDLPALQQAGGAKKARSGGSSQSSGGSAEAAAAAALRRNNALPITSFFSKAPSGSRQ
ncbi:hypothetical protein C2E21_1164 [Chlorella sorokiniana]|uniref:RING-type domain-containing protein n=1 Tax=Chlorella sorokiniana TaxID=3076 RepID=A0A2P6U255_CHLSO|nr:hypothetical protein C2E21_1164 [Chlorella sorokiniana]|eukprot:PRW60389.1 hypothetical protein C2E21_1164 [Chlorella sorokiniana]